MPFPEASTAHCIASSDPGQHGERGRNAGIVRLPDDQLSSVQVALRVSQSLACFGAGAA